MHLRTTVRLHSGPTETNRNQPKPTGTNRSQPEPTGTNRNQPEPKLTSTPDLTINHSVIEHTTYSNFLNAAARNILT